MQHNGITACDEKKLWGEASNSSKISLSRTLLSIMKDGVFFFDANMKIHFANPVFSNNTGLENYKEAPCISSIYPDPVNKQALANAKAALESLGYWSGELSRQTTSGETVIEELRMANNAEVACSDEKCPSYVAVVRDISNEREAIEQLAWTRNHDVLTGLPNRALFCAAVDSIIKRSDASTNCLVIVSADIDNFKQYNTDFGHDYGDKLLKAIAQRISSTIRIGDIIARTAGDEFTALMTVRHINEAEEAAKRLMSSFDAAIEFEDKSILIHASLGVSCWPKDGNNAAELLASADIAQQACKDAGRNSICLYSEHLYKERKRKTSFAADLREALDNEKLAVHYQPVIDVAKGTIESVEALARWYDPLRGQIAPDNFIPLAEETGLIIRLGEKIIRSACRQGGLWLKENKTKLKVAVNVSTVQLDKPEFPELIAEILSSTGLEPECLIIEITESVLLQNMDNAIRRLVKLKALGITLSVDDFGTGYSSLSYIKNLPIDIIKIDREFIKDIEKSGAGREIVSGIISLAHRMGLKIVAEGVETAEQYYLLRAMNCDYAQGFLFSYALPPNELENRYLERGLSSSYTTFLLRQ